MTYLRTRNPGTTLPSLFDRFDGFFPEFGSVFEPLRPLENVKQMPRLFGIDATENEKGYTLKVDLPGVSREHVTLGLEDRVLSIEVDCECSTKSEENEKVLLSERSSIKGRRLLTLPEAASEENVEASLEHGVLTISVPKAAKTQKKLIEIS